MTERAFRYILLTITQTLYAYVVERDIVFVGKRKTLDKRVRAPFIFPPRTTNAHAVARR